MLRGIAGSAADGADYSETGTMFFSHAPTFSFCFAFVRVRKLCLSEHPRVFGLEITLAFFFFQSEDKRVSRRNASRVLVGYGKN